jgi:hypothetical protein
MYETENANPVGQDGALPEDAASAEEEDAAPAPEEEEEEEEAPPEDAAAAGKAPAGEQPLTHVRTCFYHMGLP